MVVLRAVLVIHLIALTVYTALVIDRGGWDLLAVFFGDMAAIGWPGQFNLDFMGFLALSALWTAWRGRFAPGALALGGVAFFWRHDGPVDLSFAAQPTRCDDRDDSAR